jgi:hypothetical protein
MKFLAPAHTDAIYLARGPIDVKRPARGQAYVTVNDPTQGDRMQLAAAGFAAAPPKAEKAQEKGLAK